MFGSLMKILSRAMERVGMPLEGGQDAAAAKPRSAARRDPGQPRFDQIS